MPKKIPTPIVNLLKRINSYGYVSQLGQDDILKQTFEFERLYLKKHPCEAGIMDGLIDEIEKVTFVKEQVLIFLEKVKEVEGPKALESEPLRKGIYEGVYEIISGYYPHMSFDKFCRLISSDIGGKKIEIRVKKLTQIAIADAVANNFQITICNKMQSEEAHDIECLCWLIQALKDANFEIYPISKIIGKTEKATRKLSSRCGKHINNCAKQFKELYLQTIGQTDQKK